MRHYRHLVLVLGDQLDEASAAFDGFDADQDGVAMMEVAAESTHVWSSKIRIALFLSAMRHFRDRLREKDDWPVEYVELDDRANTQALDSEVERLVRRHHAQKLIAVETGDWRVEQQLQAAAKRAGVELELREDRHFFSSREDFRVHAKGRKQLRLEYFYRELRKRHGVLIDDEGKPEGGEWNYDADNRESFGKDGPPADMKAPMSFAPDAVTQEVIALVERRFGDHPGNLSHFDWPVTTEQARRALTDFIKHRLPQFGRYQDAMWTEEPWLFHSRISAAMNLKLLPPREVVDAAVEAYRRGDAPLAATEGFVRQILGWREYVRGLYWLEMPDYVERSALRAKEALPEFYWTGRCEMRCLRDALGQTLERGYAHHIQRLMVTGLYGLLLGIDPRKLHEWYLAVYVDAVEWVELPNTMGMSQFADGGRMASKPYVATGKYIQRMSNYCAGCAFDPAEAVGEKACPFTTLYWDFLERHETLLRGNRRMQFQVRNLDRLSDERRRAIRERAAVIRKAGGAVPAPDKQEELPW
ncbi:cryptochrome/photolyase family protein [Actomonas aquatica]|uniref:Cryptochrome/photolyase family protein n=1 Tax=Actomonas aquatica TaxID=2866162 RepID=A0ABZ1CAJ0_9BACT|nr:cryptochrome/photolyase family protein [Opitutus sp. WL0086]WRQ88412.1 cryptochrome/photolyase family protein [Opitutus sp. WL0086]